MTNVNHGTILEFDAVDEVIALVSSCLACIIPENISYCSVRTMVFLMIRVCFIRDINADAVALLEHFCA